MASSKIKQFVAFCPKGAECRFKNARLGNFKDVDGVKKQVINHLMYSSYHQLGAEEAEVEAEMMEIVEEEVAADDVWYGEKGDHGKGQGYSKGKDKGEYGKGEYGKGNSSSWHRSEPYTPAQSWEQQLQVQTVPAAGNTNELLESIVRCHAAACAAAKLARTGHCL